MSPEHSGAFGMGATTNHKNLLAWQKSLALANKVYAATRLLPSEDPSGLNQQLRRAAISIASNIAEGCTRATRAEFIQFLHTAGGSLSQIEIQVMIAADQRLITDHQPLLDDIAEISRLLQGLIRTLACASRTAHAKACAPDHVTTNH